MCKDPSLDNQSTNMDIMNNVEADPTEINVSDQHEELSESIKFSVHSFSILPLPLLKL